MSFQEKNISVTLVSFSLILIFYTIRVFQMATGDGLNSTDLFRLWGIVIVLGIIDALVISLIIAFWPGNKGLFSQFYVFYYPIILAFAFVFPGRLSALYTIFTLVLYSATCFVFSPEFLNDMLEIERLVIRLITIGATGMIGAYYYRIQRSRRRQIYVDEIPATELAEG